MFLYINITGYKFGVQIQLILQYMLYTLPDATNCTVIGTLPALTDSLVVCGLNASVCNTLCIIVQDPSSMNTIIALCIQLLAVPVYHG